MTLPQSRTLSRTMGRMMGWVLLLMVVAMGVAGCAPNADANLVSPQLGEQLYALEANQEVVLEPTPEPMRIANMSEEEITAGLDEEFAAALAAAEPSNGESLALANGCVGCHSLDPNQQMAGPTWFHVGDTAANRVSGQSPALYLRQSIVSPNEHVVDGFPSGVMPQNYGEILSQEQLADLVAYLLQQHE